jgi:chromosome segregation ATPase
VETITAQTNEAIRSLESQVGKLGGQLQTAREELGELEEALFVERENTQSMQESMGKVRGEAEEGKRRAEELERAYEQLLEENREKDESMFELGGKIYELESRMKEMEEEKAREIEELNNSLNVKYDEDYQEIYQKIEFIEKEKEYFKEKCQEKEDAISRKNEDLKHKDIEEAELKKAYEDKVKKLEEEKLAIFTDKNKEIAKILDDNKSQFEALRAKESEIRKVAHELEISRATLQKQEGKIKEMQSDRNSQVKVYQAEIENLRKKELTFKSYKDLIRTNQWNCEREVRKNIQNFIKKVLEVGEKEVRNENVISLIKGLEEGLLGVIANIAKD